MGRWRSGHTTLTRVDVSMQGRQWLVKGFGSKDELLTIQATRVHERSQVREETVFFREREQIVDS